MASDAKKTVKARRAADHPQDIWSSSRRASDERPERRDSEPAIVPSVLFDKNTVRKLNWKAYYGF